MIRMYEIFSVPSNSEEDVEVYRLIFENLFNLTNISDIRSNASSVTTAQFELHRSTIYDYETARRRRKLALGQTYTINGIEYGLEELENLYRAVDCGAAQYLVQVQLEAIVRDPAARSLFFSVAYGYALADQLKNFAIVPCDTMTFQNIQLDVIPAPSPPPPNDWVVPPSPPVFVYEVITMSSALGGSGLFLLFGCLCCAVFGGKSPRGRHASRFWGTKTQRLDRMPYAKREHELRGEDWHDGPFKGDVPMRAREMLSAANDAGELSAAWDPERAQRTVAALTFDTLLGNRPARKWSAIASQ